VGLELMVLMEEVSMGDKWVNRVHLWGFILLLFNWKTP
jgi:hypothetical protein